MNKTIDKKQVIDLQSVVDYAEGRTVSRELLHSATGCIIAFAFDAGQGLGQHTAAFEVMLQILDGEAEIMIEGETFHPKAGDILIIPKNAVHAVTAHVRFKMLLTRL